MYKRGKATPYLGAWHSTDVSEFYGASTSPDFIGTDALSKLTVLGERIKLLRLIDIIKSILPIPWTQWFL